MRKTHNGSPGLWTAPNSELAPPGALKRAINCAIRRPGLIEKRRPFEQVALSNEGAVRFEYNGHLYNAGLGSVSYNPSGLDNNHGAWTVTLVPGVDFGRYGTFEANRCIYDGQYKIDADGGTPYRMGVARALDVQPSLVAAGTLLASGQSVAYRVVFGIVDAKGNLVLGAPSGRATITATAAQNVSLKAWIPASVYGASNATSYFYQAYRTSVVASGIDPGEEMQLVYQAYLTATDIANHYVTFTDATPDGLRGAALYTSPSQEGIAAANHQPPSSLGVAYFKNQAFFLNTTSKHRARVQAIGTPPLYIVSTGAGGITKSGGNGVYTLLSSPDLSGIPTDGTAYLSSTGNTSAGNNGDFPITAVDNVAKTITVTNAAAVTEAGTANSRAVATKLTIGGTNYYASLVAETTTAPYRYLVTTSGAAQSNVDSTVKSLLRVLNQTHATVYGYYESGPDDGAGKVLLEEQSIGGSSFSVTAQGYVFANTFVPALQTSAPLTSKNDRASNRLYFSKVGQPESVPLANYLDIGGKDGLAVVALRESLLVFKSDGLFRVTSDGAGNLTVTEADSTLQLLGATDITNLKCYVAKLGGRCMALTSKGVVAVSDTGIEVVSGAVSDLINRAVEASSAYFPQAYLLASEQDSTLYVSASANGYVGTFTYNALTRTWACGLVESALYTLPGYAPAYGGLVASNRRLYLNTGGFGVFREAWQDYDDGEASTAAGGPFPSDRWLITIGAESSVGGVTSIPVTVPTTAPFNDPAGLVGWAFVNDGGYAAVVTGDSNPGGANRVLTMPTPAHLPVTRSSGTYQYIWAPISQTVEWAPYTAGDDGQPKVFREVSILLDPASTVTTASVSMYTEATTSTQSDVFTSATAPLPAGTSGLMELRCTVPPSMRKARRLSVVLTHNTAAEYVFIRGISYVFDGMDNPKAVT